jgi:hypothetical protein
MCEDEEKRLGLVSERLLPVIMFSAERNLPLRSDAEVRGNVTNGNFYGKLT